MKKTLLLGLFALSVTCTAIALPNDAGDKNKSNIECCCEECTCKKCVCESDCSGCKGCLKNEECRERCRKDAENCCNYHNKHHRKQHRDYRRGGCCGRRCWQRFSKCSNAFFSLCSNFPNIRLIYSIGNLVLGLSMLCFIKQLLVFRIIAHPKNDYHLSPLLCFAVILLHRPPLPVWFSHAKVKRPVRSPSTTVLTVFGAWRQPSQIKDWLSVPRFWAGRGRRNVAAPSRPPGWVFRPVSRLFTCLIRTLSAVDPACKINPDKKPKRLNERERKSLTN